MMWSGTGGKLGEEAKKGELDSEDVGEGAASMLCRGWNGLGTFGLIVLGVDRNPRWWRADRDYCIVFVCLVW